MDNTFYQVENGAIRFSQTGNEYALNSILNIGVSTKVIKKDASATILNATTNALSSSVANGNEKTNIYVQVEFPDNKEDILVNDEPIIRNTLDYHAIIRKARDIEKDIKNLKV